MQSEPPFQSVTPLWIHAVPEVCARAPAFPHWHVLINKVVTS